MLNRKDAPEGLLAMQANPRNVCKGCDFSWITSDPCPVRGDGYLYCAAESRKDGLDVILIKEES